VIIKRRNWLYETKTQELERRVKALEASVVAAHDRINDINERENFGDSGNHSVPQ
jgi:hypothetical protein